MVTPVHLSTRDIGRGMRVASKVEAGMIALNRGLVPDLAAPFSGVKQSGWDVKEGSITVWRSFWKPSTMRQV